MNPTPYDASTLVKHATPYTLLLLASSCHTLGLAQLLFFLAWCGSMMHMRQVTQAMTQRRRPHTLMNLVGLFDLLTCGILAGEALAGVLSGTPPVTDFLMALKIVGAVLLARILLGLLVHVGSWAYSRFSVTTRFQANGSATRQATIPWLTAKPRLLAQLLGIEAQAKTHLEARGWTWEAWESHRQSQAHKVCNMITLEEAPFLIPIKLVPTNNQALAISKLDARVLRDEIDGATEDFNYTNQVMLSRQSAELDLEEFNRLIDDAAGTAATAPTSADTLMADLVSTPPPSPIRAGSPSAPQLACSLI